MLYNIILFVIVLVCILLTIVVLLQPGQGQGLSGGLAGGMQGGAGLGARRTADLLSKSTSVLGGALIVLSLLANFAIDPGETSESAVQESGVNAPAQQQNGLDNSSESPSAVPEIPQNQGGDGNNGNGNGNNGGSSGPGSDGGN